MLQSLGLRTVFELATDGEVGGRLLAAWESLLLADLATPVVLVTGKGLVFQNVLFAAPGASVAGLRTFAEEIMPAFAGDPMRLAQV